MLKVRNVVNSSNDTVMVVLNELKKEKLITSWQEFFNTSSWRALIKGCRPIYGNCGIVYELPNFLNRPNEGLAIVDMRQLNFAEPHYHPDLEIYFVLQGEALVVVGTERYSIKSI